MLLACSVVTINPALVYLMLSFLSGAERSGALCIYAYLLVPRFI